MKLKELREKAWDDLEGNWLKIVFPITLVLVLYVVFNIGISLIIASSMPSIAKIGSGIALLALLFFALVSTIMGLIITIAKIARKKETDFLKDSFGDGKKLGFKYVGEYLKRTYGWIILCIVGFIILFYASAIGIVYGVNAPVELTAVSTVDFGYNPTAELLIHLSMLIGLVLVAIAAVKLAVKSYDYFLVSFLQNDYRDKSTKELFAKSKELMYGNRCKAMLIPASFIGWIILVCVLMVIPSTIAQLIWPSYYNIFGEIVNTVPYWAQIILSVIMNFIVSWAMAYIFMTYYEFYMEQKPLEIYNEGYEKAPTNKNYVKIAIWLGVIIVAFYAVVILLNIR